MHKTRSVATALLGELLNANAQYLAEYPSLQASLWHWQCLTARASRSSHCHWLCRKGEILFWWLDGHHTGCTLRERQSTFLNDLTDTKLDVTENGCCWRSTGALFISAGHKPCSGISQSGRLSGAIVRLANRKCYLRCPHFSVFSIIHEITRPVETLGVFTIAIIMITTHAQGQHVWASLGPAPDSKCFKQWKSDLHVDI